MPVYSKCCNAPVGVPKAVEGKEPQLFFVCYDCGKKCEIIKPKKTKP